MFVDAVEIVVKAGDGGNGVVSFRHEKYVDMGGPDGGDGGKGGDIILVASENQNTLAKFRFQKLLTANSGSSGSKRKKRGKSADNLYVPVPVGTVISHEESGEIFADLVEDSQQVVVAKGGSGGFGNAHFKSSTRQAPRVAEKGEPGEDKQLTLEMKLIADVGLVGLPNAGKSTLLSVVSNAKPKVANYPFTTLNPNLGVVDIGDDSSLLMADIPGLIEGASQGKGLGDDFLRHVERTSVLIHLVDAYQEDVVQVYKTIQEELRSYKIDLSARPQIVVLTKVEGLDKETIDASLAQLKDVIPAHAPLFAISSQTKQGLPELLREVHQAVATEREKQREIQEEDTDTMPVIRLPETANAWKLEKVKNGYRLTGKKIERFAVKTDFNSNHATERLRDIMRKMGIMHELVRRGVESGDKIFIAEIGSIEY
jgi:GTP-binding protein